MKNKTKFSFIVAFTAVLLMGLTAQMVFAGGAAEGALEDKYPYEADFMRRFVQSDIPGIEKLLQEHAYQMDLSSCLNSVLINYIWLGDIWLGELGNEGYLLNHDRQMMLPILSLLVNHGAGFVSKRYFYFSSKSDGKLEFHDDMASGFDNTVALAIAMNGSIGNKLSVIEFLLENGADPNYGAIDVMAMALAKEDFMTARLFIKYGAKIDKEIMGQSRLILYATSGDYSAVRFLVENGAKINQICNSTSTTDNYYTGTEISLRGKTAAQLAYECGEIDIYNYLVAHGATWSAPSQTARANPNQPSAPAQAPSYSSAPSYNEPSAPSTPTQSSGERAAQAVIQGLQQVQDTLRGSLDTGRYRVSGRAEEITFTGMANNGNLYYKDASGKTSSGTYSISGNRITINVLGRSFFYNITSRTSFSGNGEEWFRAGN
jgi:hypothetical protein